MTSEKPKQPGGRDAPPAKRPPPVAPRDGPTPYRRGDDAVAVMPKTIERHRQIVEENRIAAAWRQSADVDPGEGPGVE